MCLHYHVVFGIWCLTSCQCWWFDNAACIIYIYRLYRFHCIVSISSSVLLTQLFELFIQMHYGTQGSTRITKQRKRACSTGIAVFGATSWYCKQRARTSRTIRIRWFLVAAPEQCRTQTINQSAISTETTVCCTATNTTRVNRCGWYSSTRCSGRCQSLMSAH